MTTLVSPELILKYQLEQYPKKVQNLKENRLLIYMKSIFIINNTSLVEVNTSSTKYSIKSSYILVVQLTSQFELVHLRNIQNPQSLLDIYNQSAYNQLFCSVALL